MYGNLIVLYIWNVFDQITCSDWLAIWAPYLRSSYNSQARPLVVYLELLVVVHLELFHKS